jgi:cell division protein FtsB
MQLPRPSHHWRTLMTTQNGAIALGLLIALSWSWGTVSTLQKNFELQQRVDTLDQEVELADLQNQNLKFQQNYLRSNEFLELTAREKLGKAAKGEKVVVLPDSSSVQDDATQKQTPVRAVERSSNVAQWMQFFFGSKQH